MDYKKDWQEKFTEAQIFQDYAASRLFQRGILAFPYTSALYQKQIGECNTGIEFKYDRLFRKTGNFFIETYARFTPEREYQKSGLLRNDNTWLYVYGDFFEIFLFARRQLLAVSRRYKTIENNMKTAKGFLVPVLLARKSLAVEVIKTKPTEQEREFLLKSGLIEEVSR